MTIPELLAEYVLSYISTNLQRLDTRKMLLQEFKTTCTQLYDSQ